MNKHANFKWLALCFTLLIFSFSVAPCQSPPLDLYQQLDTATTALSKIKLLNRAAFAYLYTNTDSGMKWIEMSIQIGIEEQERFGEARSYGTRAILHTLNGNYALAHEDHMRSLDIKRELGDIDGMGRSYSNLAILYTDLGAFDEALFYQLKARDLFVEHRDTLGVGIANLSIGDVYKEISQWDSARKYTAQGIELCAQMGDHRSQTSGLCTMGIIAGELGDTATARAYYEEAREIYIAEDMPEGIARLQVHLGHLELSKQNPTGALRYFQGADEYLAPLGEARAYLENLIAIGDAYLLMEDHQRAISQYLTTIDSAETMGSMIIRSDALRKLSGAYSDLGRHAEAYACRLEMETLEDSLYSIDKERELAAVRTRYEVGKREQEIKILEQDNEIAELKLDRNRSLLGLATGIVIAILALLALLSIRNRIARSKARNQQLELEQKLLRTQMNPHFIFNALGAIQHYIHDHKSDQASAYLGQFAALMRMILDSSNNELVPFDTEAKGLRNYLELQKLRFPGKFDYALTMTPEVEAAELLLPPMLAQPFIENAVEHAFKGLASGGRIEVGFSREGEELVVEVRDNGRGIQQGDGDRAGHESRAIEITNQRLRLLEAKEGKRGKLSIVDLKTQNTEAHGTCVTISLPWTTEWN